MYHRYGFLFNLLSDDKYASGVCDQKAQFWSRLKLPKLKPESVAID